MSRGGRASGISWRSSRSARRRPPAPSRTTRSSGSSSSRASHSLKSQDYHGLRRVSDTKRLVDGVAGDPDNLVACINHERNLVANLPGDLAIHEEVLQFPGSRPAGWAESVTWTASPHTQSGQSPIAPDKRLVSISAVPVENW